LLTYLLTYIQQVIIKIVDSVLKWKVSDFTAKLHEYSNIRVFERAYMSGLIE